MFDLEQLVNNCGRCGGRHRDELHFVRKAAASALALHDGSLIEAARISHASTATIRDWLEHDREFQQLYERARLRAVRKATRRLRQIARALTDGQHGGVR